MKTQDQIQDYIDTLVQQGIGAYTAAPPLYRWLWRMGINIAPPFNQTFFHHFIFLTFWWTGTMAVSMTLLIMLLNWGFGSGDSYILVTALTQPTFYPVIFGGGVGFGLIMASYIKYRSKNLKIPKWDFCLK